MQVWFLSFFVDMAHAFYVDPSGGKQICLVFDKRIGLMEYLGISPIKIGDFCHRFGYKQYLIDIIVPADELDLWQNYNGSWLRMRQIVEAFSSDRLRGRDCYHAAKDICIDGLFTDLLVYFMRKRLPDFDLRKNKRDQVFDLLPGVGHEPDFIVNGAWVEMKISKTETDDSNRSNWTGHTFTLRPSQVGPQLHVYDEYSPLFFLRINYDEKKFAVIKRSDFKPSYGHDGSWFAHIRPIEIKPQMDAFIDELHAELQRATRQ